MASMDNISCDGISVDIDSTVDGVKYDVTEDHDVNGMEQCNELNSCVRDTKVKEDNKGLNTDMKIYDDAIDVNIVDKDRKLECIPTEINENGVEVVVFDEIMVAEGIKRWDLTVFGFFVGHKMSVNELRYNLRRMWSRFGFKDIVDYNNGVYYMKFHNEEGLSNVVNSGPWMVDRKPLVVQKWSVELKLDNTELERIPLWVRLCNIPVEAWTVKGVSALASRIGKPLIMDVVTASKCKNGVGLVRFARVLIEVNAKKEMVDNIKVVYKCSEGIVHTTTK
ncbi:zinc knuckle CX2CX4HX4C containing protein [Tanacetum coccineum]